MIQIVNPKNHVAVQTVFMNLIKVMIQVQMVVWTVVNEGSIMVTDRPVMDIPDDINHTIVQNVSTVIAAAMDVPDDIVPDTLTPKRKSKRLVQ